MALRLICVPLILIFSLLTIGGAYFAFHRTSYMLAMLGGLGGILSIGFVVLGPLLSIVAMYLIHTNKEEFIPRPSLANQFSAPSPHDYPPRDDPYPGQRYQKESPQPGTDEPDHRDRPVSEPDVPPEDKPMKEKKAEPEDELEDDTL